MDYKANVSLYTKPGSLKGIASISIEDEFVVRGLMVREGQNGLFVNFPSTKIGNDYKDVAFPITAEARNNITKVVLDAYHQELKQVEEQINGTKQGQQEKSETQGTGSKKQASAKSQKSGAKQNASELSSDGQDEALSEEPSEPVMGM